jgi:hypothetical protein
VLVTCLSMISLMFCFYGELFSCLPNVFSPSSQAKCGALETLVKHYGSRYVLKRYPDFLTQLLNALSYTPSPPFFDHSSSCTHVFVLRIVSARNAAGRVLEITLRSLKPTTPTPVASSAETKEPKEASGASLEDQEEENPAAAALNNVPPAEDLALDVWLAPVSAALLSASSSKVRDGLLLYALLPLVQLFPGGLRPLLRSLVGEKQTVRSLIIPRECSTVLPDPCTSRGDLARSSYGRRLLPFAPPDSLAIWTERLCRRTAREHSMCRCSSCSESL